MTTRKQLQFKVDCINAKTGKKYFLDYNRYYGGYFLSETINEAGARRDTTYYRMSASTMMAHLEGILYGLELSEKK